MTALMPQMDGIDDTKDVVAARRWTSYRKHLLIFPQKMRQYAGANPGMLPAQSESEMQKKI